MSYFVITIYFWLSEGFVGCSAGSTSSDDNAGDTILGILTFSY